MLLNIFIETTLIWSIDDFQKSLINCQLIVLQFYSSYLINKKD